MASSSAQSQLERIKIIVERAANDPTCPCHTRRDAFKELIAFTHSPHPSLKSYAASHIHVFFNDFPDLEEDAINAVYDLCEDQDSTVRVDGYNAVTRVSTVQHRWVKRNADVLVQLLQSDEPDEVAVVKVALLRHLDMDPPATLGVLCDQIVPPEEDPDDYEQQTRERLRSLVLLFLAKDAMGAIEKYTDPPDSEAEQILVSQLTLSITRLDTRDVDVIVKDVLLPLPCYRKGYSRGNDLLQPLLSKAMTPLQTRSDDPEVLKIALRYLSLAQTTAVDRRAASPIKLLHYYVTHLTRKMVLQKFLQEDRVTVISWIMDALSASEAETGIQTQQVLQLRRQIVDASSILLEVLLDSKLYSSDLWRAVKILLRAIDTRKELEKWTLPSHLVTSIRKFQVLLTGDTQDNTSEIQGLIRSLTGEQPSTSQGPSQEVKTTTKRGTNVERPIHLPERPVTGSTPISTSKVNIARSSSRLATQQSPPQDHAGRRSRISVIPTSPKRPSNFVEDVPQPKRARQNPNGHNGSTPSLLSRIADAAGDAGSTGSSERMGRKRGKRTEKEQSPEPGRHPSTGYSIKGAASARRDESGTETPRPYSLLDRLKVDEDGRRKK
ncbi:hypothetical protein PAXRUDRAFT_827847 [Paxillus rubicundulus Ve08.2h10]|uniref:Uncharacterized protein n=1 Tax=Paxillus rubicundulus Ve08.2h10 TaxID=930991 RepID=A0A0D0E833_9AGAM|nr:hypothetical protein PAXRUDRAFT_827847 [Paxillus rubicundulus Ve08.2h10]